MGLLEGKGSCQGEEKPGPTGTLCGDMAEGKDTLKEETAPQQASACCHEPSSQAGLVTSAACCTGLQEMAEEP